MSKKKTANLKYLLCDLFETESESDVFEIQTWKKANGFKIDFAINVWTAMHPNDCDLGFVANPKSLFSLQLYL